MKVTERINPVVAMTCVFALVLALFAPFPASAGSRRGPGSSAWDNVLRLRRGETVVLTLFSKRVYSGKVESVEPNVIKISIQKKQGSVLIPREEIKSVVHTENAKAMTIGLLGASGGILLATSANLIGATQQIGCLNGVSTLPGLTNCSKINHTGFIVAGVGVATGGIGTAFLIGKPKYIYQVDSPPLPSSQDVR